MLPLSDLLLKLIALAVDESAKSAINLIPSSANRGIADTAVFSIRRGFLRESTSNTASNTNAAIIAKSVEDIVRLSSKHNWSLEVNVACTL